MAIVVRHKVLICRFIRTILINDGQDAPHKGKK